MVTRDMRARPKSDDQLWVGSQHGQHYVSVMRIGADDGDRKAS